MDPTRIAALLEPFLGSHSSNLDTAAEVDAVPRLEQSPLDSGNAGAALTEFQLEQISTYIDLLLRWNARINLTAIREPEEIVTRHFGESLFLACHLFPLKRNTSLDARAQSSAQSQVRAIDIGSGAGFPALPLKIWAPSIHLTLIESNHKKTAFLREVVRALTLTNVNVIAARAETLLERIRSVPERLAPPSPETSLTSSDQPVAAPVPIRPADVVTFRAVEKFESILPLAVRFLAPAGHLALLISAPQLEQVESHLQDFEWSARNIRGSHSRRLLLAERKGNR